MDKKFRNQLVVHNHFIFLIYPFYYALPLRKTLLTKEEGIESFLFSWESLYDHWWKRFEVSSEDSNIPTLDRLFDDTLFFLPYIRRHLFPELHYLAPDMIYDQNILEKANDFLESEELFGKARNLYKSALLRLTLRETYLEPFRNIDLVFDFGDSRFQQKFSTDWIDVLLWPQHVGMLVMKLYLIHDEHGKDETSPPPDSEMTPPHDQVQLRRIPYPLLNDFLYYIRMIHPPRVGWTLPQWKHDERTWYSKDIVDYLLQPLSGKDSVRTDFFTYQDVLKENPFRYTHTPKGQVYGQNFRLYIWACMDDADDLAGKSYDTSPFPDLKTNLLYELATCTDTTEPTYIPHETQVHDFVENYTVRLWNNWSGMALHDNVAFMSYPPSKFTLTILPHNIEYDYLHTYFVALYQKVRLSFFHGELIRTDRDLYKNLREARKLWEDFMYFINYSWFHEISFRPQGNLLYHTFQKGLVSPPLFQEVYDQLHLIQNHYERINERHVNRLLRFLSFIGLPLALLVDIVSNAIKPGSVTYFVLLFLFIFVILITLLYELTRLWKE